MNGNRPALSLILVAAVVALPGAGIAADDAWLPSPRVDWLELETANFRIVGDLSSRRMKEIAEGLELFRASLLLLKPQDTARSPLPTLVLAFAGQKSFRPYGTVGLESGRDVAGVFRRTRWGNYIVFDASAGGDSPLHVVHHEYVHFFVDTNYPSTPLWLNEGLAEYFSTFRASKGSVQLGRPVRYHVHELRDGWRLPLARMLEVTHDDPEYREGDKVGPFYAQSWLLVHYALVGEPGMAARLIDLLGRLDAGQPLGEAFPAAFGMSFEDFESRLSRYVKQPAFHYANAEIGALGRPGIGEPIEISRGSALALLGEYLAHVRAFDAARAHLAEAARLEPESGDVLALQAYLEEKEDRVDRARDLYARAAGMRMSRAASAAHAARFALDRAEEASGEDARRVELEVARAAAARASEIDPDYGEPWALRGLVELRLDDPPAALVSLTQAQRRMPDREDVVYNRFLAAMRADLLVAARGIATGPLKRLDPERAAEALETLESRETGELVDAAFAESNRRMAAGDLDTAAQPLREVLAKVADPEQRRYLESHIESLEAQAVEKRLVDEYNRAVGLANAGNYGEAKAVLDAMLEVCGEESVCAAAKEFRDQLARHLRR